MPDEEQPISEPSSNNSGNRPWVQITVAIIAAIAIGLVAAVLIPKLLEKPPKSTPPVTIQNPSTISGNGKFNSNTATGDGNQAGQGNQQGQDNQQINGNVYKIYKTQIHEGPRTFSLTFNINGDKVDTKKLSLIAQAAVREFNQGNKLLRSSQLAKAQNKYHHALTLDPELAAAFNNLAFTYFKQKNYGKAIELWKRAVSKDSKNPIYYANLGNGEIAARNFQSALPALRMALRLQPKDDQTRLNLINAVLKINIGVPLYGDKAEKWRVALAREALQVAQGFITQDPNWYYGYSTKADIYIQLNDFKQAEANVRKAVKLAPGKPDPHTMAGVLYFDGGQIKEATEQLELAIRLDPNWAPAYFRLAMVKASTGQNEAALTLLQKALAIEPAMGVNLRSKENWGSLVSDPRFQQLARKDGQ